jgi:hypothetical protein
MLQVVLQDRKELLRDGLIIHIQENGQSMVIRKKKLKKEKELPPPKLPPVAMAVVQANLLLKLQL